MFFCAFSYIEGTSQSNLIGIETRYLLCTASAAWPLNRTLLELKHVRAEDKEIMELLSIEPYWN